VEVLIVSSKFRRAGGEELRIPAAEVRPGDRLVGSGIRVVEVGRTASDEILIITETGNAIPMPAKQPVTIWRPRSA
jgi:hypothetical protein